MESIRQVVTVAVEIKDGQIHRIGKAWIKHPALSFGGGEIKWYEDKRKGDR